MFREVIYNDYSNLLLKQLPQGVFLTVKSGDKLNTMTIGWGSVGFIWRNPVFTVAVRYSRYTYKLIDEAGEFTVSVPLKKEMKKELAYCGTRSGRDVNKFDECKFTIVSPQVITTPVIGECDLHFECRVVYKQAMEPALVDKGIKTDVYSNNDYHVLYYGEILSSYLTTDF